MTKLFYNISDVDLAWTAGFLEGEGSFARCGNTIKVSAVQVEIYPIKKLIGLFGGNEATYHRKEIRSNGGSYYRWDVYGVEAAEIMLLLFHMLSPKRKQQIIKCFCWWKDRPGSNNRGGYSKEQQNIIRNRVKDAFRSSLTLTI